MGLDVYVGSLTRYYAGDWLTAMQQYGRDNGIDVQIVRDAPDPEDKVTDPDELRKAVGEWRASLADGLGCAADWPEGADLPYWTDQPDWDAFGAIVLAAAYDIEPRRGPNAPRRLPRPRKPDDPCDWASAPAVRAAATHPEPYVTLLSGVEWWLPVFEGPKVFAGQRPDGEIVGMGRIDHLVGELEWLAGRLGLSDQARRDEVREAGPLPAGAPVLDVARYGLSVLLPLARRARDERQPLLLDY
ncbi:hypothetical protein [Actinophytocola sp.]|uniref:hypothetical protein n=1 Tax=Actinophytocola sp. TaxID=1872138 RepID=UPI002D7FE18A|nr:hypothetical protein [Actinophytocola sp.]HET9141417.1 hypothetical protein [Actinophytocola sp.]